jgi:hypothetical protein
MIVWYYAYAGNSTRYLTENINLVILTQNAFYDL